MIIVKAEYIFYGIGIVFLFATISYFSYQYLFNLSDSIKTAILVFSAIAFFFIADFMAERGI